MNNVKLKEIYYGGEFMGKENKEISCFNAEQNAVGHVITGRRFNCVPLDPRDVFKGYDVITIDLKKEHSSFNPLMAFTDEDTTNRLIKELGVNEEKQDLYVALAGLVSYGGFLKEHERSLRTMAILEPRPIEQLDKLFEDEHRSGKLPVFFYECWKKYKNRLSSVNESW